MPKAKANVELKSLTLRVLCTCGKPFLAEDLEPECPYCERRYTVRLRADAKLLELEIEAAQ